MGGGSSTHRSLAQQKAYEERCARKRHRKEAKKQKEIELQKQKEVWLAQRHPNKMGNSWGLAWLWEWYQDNKAWKVELQRRRGEEAEGEELEDALNRAHFA